MIDLQNVQIIGVKGNAEIIRNLKIIYTTPQGTVPFDRAFGIDMSILDGPINIAKAKLTVEFINQAKKYESRVKVDEVTFDIDATNGTLTPRVVVSNGS
jgi:Phage baseplate assembly protein W